MPLFQSTVVTKYLNSQDQNLIDSKWESFRDHFHNPSIQENIRNSNEEQYQGEFLIDLFVNVLGYTKNPTPDFNLTTEYKNVKDSKKADGAIIIDGRVRAVIELKGTETTDLSKIETQAFGYKNNQPDCSYIVTANFEKLRFYIDNATEHIEFNLFQLSKENFQLLFLCLGYENIAKDTPQKLKNESLSKEDEITKELYKDYSVFKRELHSNLVKLNPQFDPLTLFKKSQKLLDRFLFLFFAEDRLLLPPNSVRLVLSDWKELQERDVEVALYERFKKYFGYLNTGYKGKRYDVYPYNGGLFKPDEVLDEVSIDDELLYNHTLKLSEYDFESEVDVNILGHIFENSLTEIEQVQAELEGQATDKSKSKRKKDGVFYTPKYITKYIVENTVGKLCEEKKVELDITDENYQPAKQRSRKRLDNLQQYRDWLLQITICDPACGSGAFLNQALEYLIAEHQYIDELSAKYNKDALILSDVENSILENNLFGVDINEESVEIAKLSLWLRTAQKNRKLNDLSNNIKCGNSLIDDPEIAGKKAFEWETEFEEIFKKGGFDVIIGNPPYVNIVNIANKEFRTYFQKNYSTYKNKSDLFSFFIEREITLLKKGGICGNIFPNSWMGTSSFSKFRSFLLTHTKIISLVKLPTDVFDDAVVKTIIMTFAKEDKSKADHIIQLGEFSNSEFKRIPHSLNYQDILSIESKTFSFDRRITINGDCKLGEVVDFALGIKTSDDKRFVFKEKKNNNCLPFLRGKNVEKYYSEFGGEYIWYMPDLIKEKPGGRPRVLEHYLKDKVIIQDIAKNINATLDCQNYLVNDTLNIIHSTDKSVSLRYILVILNSKLINKWFSTTFHEGLHIKINQLEQIPIKIIDDNRRNSFETKAKIMLELKSELNSQKNKFIKRLNDNLGLKKISNKINSFYEMEFKSLLLELGKQKLKISLSDQDEWEDFFLVEKEKILAIKSKIDEIDKEIDQMVYELYELTEEEIEIIENS